MIQADANGNIIPLNVKLVIVDLESACDALGSTRMWLMQHIADAAQFSKYGLVHAAIQMGSYMMHFLPDNLVHMSSLKSSSSFPIVAVDVKQLDLNMEEDVQKIGNVCQVIVQYNVEEVYCNLSKNCHHFVDDVLSALGAKQAIQHVNGQLGEYLRSVRTELGIKKKKFTCPLTQKQYVFETHKALDQYCLLVCFQEM